MSELSSRFHLHQTHDPESSFFDRQTRMDWWNQDKIQSARLMIVGAGAIGNETLKNLALLGYADFFITDFDEISKSNLSRTVLFRKSDQGKRKAAVAAERVAELALADNPQVSFFDGDIVWEIGTGVYRRMDMVLGCLDNIETRLAVNKHCYLVGTPWIDAGIFELGLRVNLYTPPAAPCYQCSLSPQQWQAARQRYSCDDFKKKVVAEGKVPTVQIASALVSALQVQEVTKFLCGQPHSAGKQLYFQGKNNDFEVFEMPLNSDCQAHQMRYPDLIETPLSHQDTLRHLLTYLEEKQGEPLTLDFRGDRTFVAHLACRGCGTKIELYRPTFRIEEEETICATCRDKEAAEQVFLEAQTPTPKETIGQFSLHQTPDFLLDFTLNDLGIPFLHILALYNQKGEYIYIELSKDADKLWK
ncbi:ThiF family adenylyltransferase [Hugenholtzia roseola]|uniref:ThiF family adenylyltransferase n=1 Tax=Hugenholtzia roseola TaxID=1002 RepID=UPI0003FF9EBC|nr:ThiF family adenylyltransferase [Hugenholtzia roseola]